MLEIDVAMTQEGWDEENQVFIEPEFLKLRLEHSLLSVSKWESKWKKPFLTKKEKSEEEIMDYVKFMTLNPDISPDVYNRLSRNNVQDIKDYISDPMTATTFSEGEAARNNREVVTNEVIYHWMVTLNIPFECQEWHLNRLLTLVKVCNVKNAPPKKRSKGDIMRRNHALNKARRNQLNSRG